MPELFSTHSHLILNSLRRLVRSLHIASRQSEKQLGMSAAQLFALKRLEDGKKRSLNELAELTLTHQSSLSVVVRKLVEKGLIQSQAAPDDARRLMLGVTAKGKKVLEKASTSVQDKILIGLAAMEARDRAQLACLLNELLDRAGLNEAAAELFFEYDDNKKKGENHERRKKTARAVQRQGSSGAG